jgi:hypothetical protein
MAALKPKLEPLLNAKGLEWTDILPVLNAIDSVEELTSAVSDPAAFLEKLANLAKMGPTEACEIEANHTGKTERGPMTQAVETEMVPTEVEQIEAGETGTVRTETIRAAPLEKTSIAQASETNQTPTAQTMTAAGTTGKKKRSHKKKKPQGDANNFKAAPSHGGGSGNDDDYVSHLQEADKAYVSRLHDDAPSSSKINCATTSSPARHRAPNFTLEEDDAIIAAQAELGNKWALISTRVPGRDVQQIQNRWNSCLRKRARRAAAKASEGKAGNVEKKKRSHKKRKTEHLQPEVASDASFENDGHGESNGGRGKALSYNNDLCAVCGNGGDLVCCDNCPKAYHQKCLPELKMNGIPTGMWHCPVCVKKGGEDDDGKARSKVSLVEPLEGCQRDNGRLLLGRLLQAIELIYPPSTVEKVLTVLKEHMATNGSVGLCADASPMSFSSTAALPKDNRPDESKLLGTEAAPPSSTDTQDIAKKGRGKSASDLPSPWTSDASFEMLGMSLVGTLVLLSKIGDVIGDDNLVSIVASIEKDAKVSHSLPSFFNIPSFLPSFLP